MQQPDHDDSLFEDREDAPFLAEQASAPPRRPSRTAPPTAFREKLRIRLMITLFTIILLVETGNAMTQGPITRIYEDISCRSYYAATDPSQIGSDGQVPESQCKGREVQGEVAIVKGYGELFDGIASIVLAVPYGLLADRIGRKPTLLWSIPGFVLNILMTGVILYFSNIFPLRAVWVSALSWLFGGGLVVAAAVIWTMMADVTTEAQRSAMFFQFGVAVMGSEFLSNSFSSWLMVMDPWIPLILGWCIIIVGILLALTLPETMHAVPKKSKQYEHELSDLSTDDGERDPPRFERPFEKEARPQNLRTRIKSAASVYSFITEQKQVMLLLSAFLVYRLSRGTSWFLTQYVSVRYGWTIASANMLVSLKSILMVILFIAILPAASWYLIHRRGIESRQKDLILTKASVISLLAGTLGIGLSPHVAIMIFWLIIQTMGAGFVYTTRSLVTTMIHRDQTARLYTAIEIIQAFGMILASPTMTTFFKWGLDIGDFWTGLAWMVASGLFAVVAAVLWLVKLPPRSLSDEDEGIAL